MADVVTLGNGFRLGLGTPRRDGDAVLVKGILAHEGRAVSPVIYFRWYSDANIEMTDDQGEEWAPPRGTDFWSANDYLTAVCSEFLKGV